MTRSIKALLVGLAMAGVATTVLASQRQVVTVRKIEVGYGDLNLRSETGAATLLGRLSKAATKVCSTGSPAPAEIQSKNAEFACRAKALRNAVVTVDNPVLTALYQSTRGEAQLKLASR